MWGEIVKAEEICDFKFIYVGKIFRSGHTMLYASVCKNCSLKLLIDFAREKTHFKIIF